MKKRLLAILVLCVVSVAVRAQNIYEVVSGSISFHSDAPEEIIRASSDKLVGALDVKKNSFAFKIDILTFMGFNSPLQREHFNENYMESDIYPQAIYIGKLIEDVDLSKSGEYDVRTKGKMMIHGIEQERIINSNIKVKNGLVYIKSDFTVQLDEHDIKIPRVVNQKLSKEIKVTVKATMAPKK